LSLSPEHQATEAKADALVAEGKHEAALALYREILEAGAGDAFVWCHAGDALTALSEFTLAVDHYKEALALAPEAPELHVNIAKPLYGLGEAHLAAAHLERAIPLTSDAAALCNLATIAPGVPGYSLRRIYEIRRAFGEALANPGLHPGTYFARAADEPPGPLQVPPRPRRAAGRPLHVAYLSAHFDQPAYMGPVWALVNHHDRSRFRVTLLADTPAEAKFPGYCPNEADTIAEIADGTDAQVTALIAQLEVDVLVDLSAYSHPQRLSLFAERPAPVVAAWFNMYATSGLPGIDYIIGDEETVYAGEEPHYSESVLRLPQSYLSFQPFEGRPPVGPSPAATFGKPFTFGSLVSLYKITQPVRDAWAAILRRAPKARLLLANAGTKSAGNRAWLLEEFARRGVGPERIVFRDPAPHAAFLGYYDEIDLALDSFPYSGGTTTMEALWQGVPVLSQPGEGWSARTTMSILKDAELPEFCCRDVTHYVDTAVALAQDHSALARERDARSIRRKRLTTSTVCDGAALARHMETLYDSLFDGL
jgi:predicted O-linked N-acetylglucosamine transferase (SPINDLY family)